MDPTFIYVGVVVINTLFFVVGWFLVRTLRTIDSNQRELATRLGSIERDFYKLHGEHESYVRMGIHSANTR